VFATRSGPALTKNLAALVAGLAPRPHAPPKFSLTILSCGNDEAIASWGPYSVQGHWVWRLKDWLDRSLVQRYRRDSGRQP
jgi:NADH dehydrogenase FAD-containing subunit